MTPTPYLVASAEHDGQRSVLRLEGELDVTSKDFLWLAVSDALERHPAVLVVDLTALRFMDCSGLSVLVETHQHLAGSNRQLLITGAQPIVRRLLRVTGRDAYLQSGHPHGDDTGGDRGLARCGPPLPPATG
jgi:anti-sigma B factor antagonist